MYNNERNIFMNITEELITKNKIRRIYDEESGEFFFSIVDTIENLKLSKDPRNYWKVLKNRLKKGHNELVTECNQLKMVASDGKYYLTDVTTADNLLQIIQVIAPKKVSLFEEFFNEFQRNNKNNNLDTDNLGDNFAELSPDSYNDGEIALDVYKKENCIYVKGMLAGVEGQNIFISLSCKTLTIKINRPKQNNENENLFSFQELSWGKFSRTVVLPFEVDIDRADATSYHGLLTIKLFILDKSRTKIIKVK